MIIPLSKHPALFCGYGILPNLFTDFFLVVVIYLFISWRLITLQYCSGFVIHWHESALDIHVFPNPIPPPTSLSTRSLWVLPVFTNFNCRIVFGLVLFLQFSLSVCIVSFPQLPWGSLSLSMSSFHGETFLEHGAILGCLFILTWEAAETGRASSGCVAGFPGGGIITGWLCLNNTDDRKLLTHQAIDSSFEKQELFRILSQYLLCYLRAWF